MQFFPTRGVAPPEGLRIATDDWPFLYLRHSTIPDLSLRGMAIMGAIAGVLVLPFLPFRRSNGPLQVLPDTAHGAGFAVQMFFLGAGFMLIQTKAVVHMALLFGSTWIVTSVVFFAMLLMILLANVFVLIARPRRLTPYYVGLAVALAANALVPMDYFLGMERTAQVAGSAALVFAPILFAGVVFASSFSRAAHADRAFGANIAGAMFGGLAEYSSMLLGFQYLLLLALTFYALSALGASRQRDRGALVEPVLASASEASAFVRGRRG